MPSVGLRGLPVATLLAMRTSSIVFVLFAAACTAHQPTNQPLAATDDDLAVEMNTPAELGVLDNDTGFDDGRVIELTTPPMHGTATLGDDGVLHYQPATDYLGDDGAEYRITNPGGDVATGHVAIAVGCATCAIGVPVTLAWDPNAPGDMIIGYRVYLGATDDTSAMTMIDDIMVTQPGFDPNAPTITYDGWTDLHLRIGAQACFALTAYNSVAESGFSNTACKIVTDKAMRFGL